MVIAWSEVEVRLISVQQQDSPIQGPSFHGCVSLVLSFLECKFCFIFQDGVVCPEPRICIENAFALCEETFNRYSLTVVYVLNWNCGNEWISRRQELKSLSAVELQYAKLITLSPHLHLSSRFCSFHGTSHL